ncbi:GTP-binding protein [Clostridium boliviensis]|uniref:GTP-binding protein n=2 Tax=Clostridium boliviensis TaxID=318465 RepID=A0ABU4GQ78_9CLOT|nr:GTP-binding protein [Clostridium boliviensis]MDW2799078.1 GTP-binding protein [Clostridium boliviensis]
MEDDFMPVFLIDGFLESGKTRFLQFTMEQDYFKAEGKTLLIVCEEGETEYSDELLKRTKTAAIYIDSLEELNQEKLLELELLYNPERVLIEWNGMWDLDDLKLPDDWKVYQQITLIDMSTFDLYAANMKSLLYSMVRNSEMIICNRCDGIEDLSGYRRTLKAMSPRGEIVFEDSEGEINEIAEEELPYDISADLVEISPEAYGIWYLDCMERRDRYEGKTVEFTAMVLKTPEFPKNYFVPGRMAMTCCEDDMTFLGFITKSRDAKSLETKQWVRVKARIAYEYWKDYEGEGPVLYAETVEPAKPVKGFVQF